MADGSREKLAHDCGLFAGSHWRTVRRLLPRLSDRLPATCGRLVRIQPCRCDGRHRGSRTTREGDPGSGEPEHAVRGRLLAVLLLESRPRRSAARAEGLRSGHNRRGCYPVAVVCPCPTGRSRWRTGTVSGADSARPAHTGTGGRGGSMFSVLTTDTTTV